MKVLIATDGSEYGLRAVEFAANQVWMTGSEIRIISVFDPPVPFGGEIYMMNTNIYEEASTAAKTAAQKFVQESMTTITQGINSDNIKVTTDVLMGAPHRRIVEEADEWGADLIIVGSHGYRMWERVLLGSVSQSVAQHAKCSVLIVRANQ
jgi:nucleotide-binding universal stress UspA family protein